MKSFLLVNKVLLIITSVAVLTDDLMFVCLFVCSFVYQALPIGVMEVVLAHRHTPSSFLVKTVYIVCLISLSFRLNGQCHRF